MNENNLIDICHYIGSKVPLWTQGAGSNISLKVEENGEAILLVKASGFRLDSVSLQSGLAKVRLNLFINRLKEISKINTDQELHYANSLQMYSLKGSGLSSPSMETGFHCLLPKKLVMHFHSLVAILMIDYYKKNKNNFSQWFKSHVPATWKIINTEKPGWTLSEVLGKAPEYQIFLLENHGVVLQSNEVNFLHEWEKFEIQFCHDWGIQNLLPLYQQKNSYALAKKIYAHTTIPFRIYFPDTAVFLSKLQNLFLHSTPINGEVMLKLKDNAWEMEQNICEIWLATQILFALNPNLGQIPENIASTIAMLPSEQIRKNILSHGVNK